MQKPLDMRGLMGMRMESQEGNLNLLLKPKNLSLILLSPLPAIDSVLLEEILQERFSLMVGN